MRACAVTADEWTNEQEIAYVPALGNGMDDLEFLFLERDWEKDKNTVAHRCRFLTNTRARAHTHTHVAHIRVVRIESWNRDETPLWLTFFPEGTDFNRVKHEKSIKVRWCHLSERDHTNARRLCAHAPCVCV